MGQISKSAPTGHLLGNSLFPQLYNEVLFFFYHTIFKVPSKLKKIS